MGPNVHEGDGWPLYWTDVVGIDDGDGPDAFPYPPVPDEVAQYGGTVLTIGFEEPEPAPATTCESVVAFDEQDDAAHPDGDFGIGWYCPDGDGESVCVEHHDLSYTWGVCEACDGDEPFKPAGCTCESDDQCATGLTCWGLGVGAGDLGRCYPATDGPPSWQCPEVCTELYGAGAW
ncbi:MAG: hypothetical protein ABMB14_06310 [Myxococcota bacterium]